MNDFLLTALFVFLVSVVTISLVFFAAIRLRLLPVQPEIAKFVDLFFDSITSVFSNDRRRSLTQKQILVVPTSENDWFDITPDNLSLTKLGTIAAATLFILPTITPTPILRVQVGRVAVSETVTSHETVSQKFIVLEPLKMT